MSLSFRAAFDPAAVVGCTLALASCLGGPALLMLAPALLLGLTALWRLVFQRREESHFFNIIDKRGGGGGGGGGGGLGSPGGGRLRGGDSSALAAFGTAASSTSFASSTSGIRPGGSGVAAPGVARYSDTFGPLACLPAPWESSALMLNIVGEGDVIIGDSAKATVATLMGVGDSEGYAMRCNCEKPTKCKFVRIGRLSEEPASMRMSPFVSEVADPFNEPIAVPTDVSADKRKAASKSADGDDTMRCGDIVMLVDQQSRKTLCTSGWWMVFTSEKVSTNCYFIVTVLNEYDGSVKYGSPVVAGSPFRLRSAKYPKYEVGCQASSSIENKGNLLVMYEFSKYLARGTVRWKQGGLVNPLFLCTLPEGTRASLPPTVAAQRRSKWNLYGGLVSTLSYLRRHPVRSIRVVGHAELLHRLLNKVFLAVIVVVSGSDEYGDKEWMCLRSPQDIDKLLASAESQQDIVMRSKGLSVSAKQGEGDADSHRPLAHESPMGQDLRLANHRFQAALKRDSKAHGTAGALFLSVLQHSSLWDCWLLDSCWTKDVAGAQPLGITLPNDKNLGSPLYSTCVARMLWESHVREELCVLYASHIACYAPLSSKASWMLSLRDIVGLADVLLEDSPLPSTFALRVETMGRIHYISCCSYETRETLRDALAAQISSLPPLPSRSLHTSSVLGGASPDSFTHLSGQWLPSTRLILNARKFAFDSQSRSTRSRWLRSETYWKLSEYLLEAASEMETLHYQRTKAPGAAAEASAEEVDDEERALKSQLLSFLDEVSLLRLVNLGAIDRSSKEALCFFSNVYHTLLLHARTVLRLPSKSDWSLFFSSVSYAIGDDVFSLTELEQCVLRGKLSRPKVTSRHEPSVLSLGDSHFHFALEKADCRLNFLLNSGSVSNPEALYLLTPRNLETQLNAASQHTLLHSMSVDPGYNIVTLPKLCEVYRADLGGDDVRALLKQCLKFIDKTNCGADLESILSATQVPVVKFLLMTYESRSRLKLVK